MIRKGIHKSAIIECHGKAHIPRSTVVEPLAVVYLGARATLELGAMNILYPSASIRIDQGHMRTGREVSFGPGCHIYEPRAGLTIGDHCLIGGGVLICGVNHGYALRHVPMRKQLASAAPIIIGDDVWIGMGAIILPGVTLGGGSIVAAGAVVADDVNPGQIVSGIPARPTRRRE